MENSYENEKKDYAAALKTLEEISEEIHERRQKTKDKIPTGPRQECVGAEAVLTESIPTHRLSRNEIRIKRILTRKKKPFTRNGLRSSLCLELGIGTEFDVGNMLESPQSPSTKSVDLGAVLSRSFEDYAVLDIDGLDYGSGEGDRYQRKSIS